MCLPLMWLRGICFQCSACFANDFCTGCFPIHIPQVYVFALNVAYEDKKDCEHAMWCHTVRVAFSPDKKQQLHEHNDSTGYLR